MTYKKIGVLSVFYFSCKIFFLKNVCLSTKFNLLSKKKLFGSFFRKKNVWVNFKISFWVNFKFLGRHQKNASHTISLYENCMISTFLKKSFLFFIWYDTSNFMPKQEKISSEIRLHHFSKMYESCLISIFS